MSTNILSKLIQTGNWSPEEHEAYTKQASECRADWLSEIRNIDNGECRKSAAQGSEFTRTTLRETGVSRKILDYKPTSDSDFQRHPDEKYPYIVNEIEANLPMPVSVNFDGAAQQWRITGNIYIVRFFDITSREFVENVRSLEIYKTDPRDYYASNTIRDIQTVEDFRFFDEVDYIVGSVENGYSPMTNQQQFRVINTPPSQNGQAFNRLAVNAALKTLTNWRIPTGSAVVNSATFTSVAGFDRTEAGGNASERMFIDGASALENGRFLGKNWLGTIKNDLVMDDTVYLFAEPNFLGVCYEHTAPTMYIEKRMDILKFVVRETIAMKIATPLSVAKIKFTNVP